MVTTTRGRVLVVEDAADLRALLQLRLTGAGYAVTDVPDGTGALDVAAREPPDVVLLDLRLPDRDGLSVLDALKGAPATANTPVIVLTGDTRSSLLADALGRGAHDYVRKPFDMPDLLARVGAASRVKHEHDRLATARQTLRSQRDFINAVMDTIDAVVLVLDAEGRVVYANRTGEQLTGRPMKELAGVPSWELFEDEEGARVARRVLERRAEQGPGPRFETPWRTVDGRTRTMSWSSAVVTHADGTFRFAVVAGVDVTAHQAADRRLRACVDVIQEGIAILDARRDADGKIVDFDVVFANPAATELDPGIMEGAPLSATAARELHATCANVVTTGHLVERQVHTEVTGDRVTFEFNVARLDDGVVVGFSDVTERLDAEERLAWAATHDALTGLANRPLLLDRIAHGLARRPAEPKSDLAVLFIDLDGFKAVNDALGHQAGDVVLAEVAVRLRGAVRPADTVARFGGDEFVVLAEELSGGDDADALSDRLAVAVAAVEAAPHRLLASIGVAVARPGDTPESILRRADEAMYARKRHRD